MGLAFEAMIFARLVHKNQQRKYTNNPYADHLAEVVGIAMTVCPYNMVTPDIFMATAWLHDCVEDQNITGYDLLPRFGPVVTQGVLLLSDLETGNRATRKAASRQRLAAAAGWVQNIKVADIISNSLSIMAHDPKFAKVYIEEVRLLLDVLTKADPDLLVVAGRQIY